MTDTLPRRALDDDDAPTLISASASYSQPHQPGLPTMREHLQDAEHWLEMAEREMRSETYNTRLVLAYTAIAQTHAQLAGLSEALDDEPRFAPPF